MSENTSNTGQNIPVAEEHDGITFEVLEEEQTLEGKVRSKGIYLFPNAVTSAAFLAGFYSITQSTSGHYEKAIIAIFLAALLDGMDGRIARWTNAQSAFGEQYDSLSDMLSFGVAPAILMYSWILAPLGRLGMACAYVFAVCAALRLARFNVQIGSVDKRYFVGLASPIAACTLVSGIWVSLDNPTFLDPTLMGVRIGYAIFAVIMGFLMISNVRYYSFKELDRKRVPFALLMPILLILMIVLYDLPIGLFVVGIVYACSGIFSGILDKVKGRHAA